MLDPERADRIEPVAADILEDSPSNFLVLDSHEGKGQWKEMESFRAVVDSYTGETVSILDEECHLLPEDNAVIMFTSGMKSSINLPFTAHTNKSQGTTGLPKGVLSTQRQFLTNILNVGIRTSTISPQCSYLLL